MFARILSIKKPNPVYKEPWPSVRYLWQMGPTYGLSIGLY